MTDITDSFDVRKDTSRPVVKPEARDADARFYLTMALVSAAIIFTGFAPSYYLKSVIHAPPPLSFLTATHGAVFTAWIVLFVTQIALIANKNPALHRQLGVMGALLFGAMISLGLSTAITAGRLGHAPPGAPAPLAFMALPLFALSGATILVTLALWNRRRTDWHKRMMLASVFILTAPGTGRIAIPLGLATHGTTISMIVCELLLAVAIAYDYRTHKTVHRAYWIAATVFVTMHLGVAWAFGSPAWLAFAKGIVQG